MALRTAIVATAFLGTIATLYHLSGLPSSIMPTSADNRPSSQKISVELSAAQAPLTVKVTVQNNSPDRTFSFLTWDSPFDPQAINTGVLSLKDAETGHAIEGPGMKLNRKLPPSREDLVEISPGSSATKELEMASPWIPTDGKRYQVKLQGSWRAAWLKPAADVTDSELDAMDTSQMSTLGFESGALEMQLKQ